jgi:hypothetical protein
VVRIAFSVQRNTRSLG